MNTRFHGRGGQGAKIASRILGRSGFLSGLFAQDFALFGAERRGAPVVSFTRLSSAPIDERGPIEEPNLVVVMDATLLSEASAQVFQGIGSQTPLLVNGDAEALKAHAAKFPSVKLLLIDLNAIARKIIGKPLVSAAAAAVAARCLPLIKLEALEEAVLTELDDFALPKDLIEKNLEAARVAYHQAPALALPPKPAMTCKPEPVPAPPRIDLKQLSGPTIHRHASAALRRTGNWRTERPVIDLTKCKRCFLCYLYCPDAAMRLDADNFPHIDYDHCKGCMICYEECPTEAISRETEL